MKRKRNTTGTYPVECFAFFDFCGWDGLDKAMFLSFLPCLDKISVGMIELISGKSPFKRCRISKNSANKIICVIFEGHLFIFNNRLFLIAYSEKNKRCGGYFFALIDQLGQVCLNKTLVEEKSLLQVGTHGYPRFRPFDNKLDFTIAGDISPEVDQKENLFWGRTRNEIGENLITSILSSIGAIFVSE